MTKIKDNEKSAQQSSSSGKTEKGDRVNLETAEAIARATHKANPDAQDSFLESKVEDAALECFAKKNNLWLENYKDRFGNNPDGQGAESDVYFSENGNIAYKINSGIHHANWVDFFNRIAAHNEYFPETHYGLEGFTLKDNKLAVILRQQAVTVIRGASAEEVKTDIEERGFTFHGINDVRDEEYGLTIRDLHDQNAIINKDGVLLYIDPIIQFDKDSKYLIDRGRMLT